MFATRWIPFQDIHKEMNRLQTEMNRLFRRDLGAGGGEYPALNVWEDDQQFKVEAELPGIELSDLQIQVTPQRELQIQGERKPASVENATWHRRERGCGSFSRSLELPTDVDEDRVEATFKHGVLTIVVPKRVESQARKVTIKAE